MLQKANELCNDVKMLGGSLLAALEKKDAEELSLLRSTHELNMLELIKDVKEKQRDEAQENLNGLFELKQNTSLRKNYYTTRELMNPSERQYYDSLTTGLALQTIQSGFDMLANIAYMAPDVKVGAPTSAGVTFGGSNVGNALKAFSSFLNIQSIQNNILGSMASTLGGFQRRMDDWKFQAKTAELELKQIDKQIVAAEIRLSIADKDLQNHAQQMEQSAEVDDYMRSKFTNLELYDWMKGKISEVYFQSYQLAYSTARKAEKCMQHELGLESTNYIQYGYWDSLKKGLMSGEQLQFALRTLENEYLTQNNRKYEITKHISLSMLDPLALIKFRTMGICEFEVPEVLFDMDHPGNYFTLIQSVSLSIPCVAGPYTSVSAHLSLLNSKFRKSTSIDGGYAEINPETKEDKRFVYNHGTAVKSIATSSAQGDSGVFELNFRDERYLPFEGAGAISKWQLELPTEIRQFDYNSIADVIIHMSYSAKDGGADFKSAVNLFLKEQFGKVHNELGETELNVGINLKNEYANEWRLLKKTGRIELEISKSRLPYLVQSFEVIVARVTFAAKLFAHTAPDFTITVGGNNSSTTSLREDGTLGLFTGETENISFDTRFELSLPEENLNKLEELVLLVGYTIKRE
ncbi:hypothetical protein [Dyadobacter sp. NIV53]|uniref:Tc toxin subunit A-related protein n=1 Tax=Dyadobacter sp. NIV53 TaxID=2861765 RepID=UPI001C88134C|nr:hypothetical protein [Dyadobacter sp. NIV53]